jgi:alkylation response protein AidB-like acyl-CoA dehydrogenase
MRHNPYEGPGDRRREIIDFAESTLNRDIRKRDREGAFDREGWKACADYGLFGGNIPEEYGGTGRNIVTCVEDLEALGYGCRDNGFTLAVNTLVWTVQEPIFAFGSEEQKQRLLPRLVRGELLAGDAISEPEAGSDAMAMTTRAEKTDKGYLINGHKYFITMAPVADLLIVYAKTNPKGGLWGLSAFLVEVPSEGLELSESHEKIGLRSLPNGEVVFRDVFVPEENRLGREGGGFSLFLQAMEWERAFIFASHVGSMEHQLEECVRYATQREQFGKKIIEHQSVSNRLADMKLRLETSQLLLRKLAWMKQEEKSAAMESSLAKLHISEAFVQSSLDAIRIHGGKGYMSEYEVERDLRDAVGGVIYGGTSDIQRNMIARLLEKQ